MPPEDTTSTRLRDRAQTAFQRRRQQATDTSTRLRDRAQTAFQQRREQVEETREAIAEGREQFAGSLQLDPGAVEPVQLNDRGTEFGFVPTDSGRETLAEQFASDREFVDADDTQVRADPIGGVTQRVAPDRRQAVATDARESLAAEREFTRAGDLDVDVGPGGVTDAELTDTGRRQRATRELEADTALGAVGTEDIEQTDDGFGLTQGAARRASARRIEDRTPEIEQGELDPTTDVRDAAEGFGLAREEARSVAAERIDEDLPGVDVAPDDLELDLADDGSFDAAFNTEVRR